MPQSTRSCSVGTVVLSSTVRVVPGRREASFTIVSMLRPARRSGSVINRCRRTARCPLPAPLRRFGANRPNRRARATTRCWSYSCSSGGLRTVMLRTRHLSTCRVKMLSTRYWPFPRFEDWNVYDIPRVGMAETYLGAQACCLLRVAVVALRCRSIRHTRIHPVP